MAILPQPGIITLPILLLSKLDRFTSSMGYGGALSIPHRSALIGTQLQFGKIRNRRKMAKIWSGR